MGCDIHLYAEHRASADAPWQSVTEPVTDGMGEDNYTSYPRFYSDRNYGLFGILSGVRWQCPHGSIARDRGIPDDASEHTLAALNHYGGDGHSHSYCTLAEILAYDFTRTVNDEHEVHAHEFVKWKRWGEARGEAPEMFYMARRPEIEGKPSEAVRISQQEMEDRLARLKAAYQAKHDAREEFDHDALRREIMGNAIASITFKVPLHDIAGEFTKRTIWQLAALGTPENVRICFFYDN